MPSLCQVSICLVKHTKSQKQVYEYILWLQNIAYLQCTRWTYNIDSAHDTKTVRHTDI